MNVYDCAHQLARALKTSDEYLSFKKSREEILKNPKLKEMIEDFQKKQIKIQGLRLTGKEIEESQLQQIQKLYEILMKDPTANEYFQAEMRFSRLMNDIHKIISEAVPIESFSEDDQSSSA